ncbi:hypothetical protein MMC29_002028, partial [Sticta canariensis]|nr:hypothetical protein [Sticta canariensis]
FFVSLAVKTKLHLDRPRDEGFDRQALLEFYDQFPFLPQYSSIKPRHFQHKILNPRQKSRVGKTVFSQEAFVFGTLTEEMDLEELEERNGSDDHDNADGYQDLQDGDARTSGLDHIGEDVGTC